jgi:ATP-dependent Clp protease ATP-binding subunit ClpB
MDSLTSKFQMALADAQSLAVGHDHPYIEPARLLLALLNQEGGTVRPLFAQAGASKEALEQAINQVRGGQSIDDPNAEE